MGIPYSYTVSHTSFELLEEGEHSYTGIRLAAESKFVVRACQVRDYRGGSGVGEYAGEFHGRQPSGLLESTTLQNRQHPSIKYGSIARADLSAPDALDAQAREPPPPAGRAIEQQGNDHSQRSDCDGDHSLDGLCIEIRMEPVTDPLKPIGSRVPGGAFHAGSQVQLVFEVVIENP